MPPDVPCAEDGCECAGRQQGVHAKVALRKYLADSGLTDVKPGGRQYTLKHVKVVVEAIAAGIAPLEFRRKVESEMRFNLVVHDPDALFNIIDQQRRDQAAVSYTHLTLPTIYSV